MTTLTQKFENLNKKYIALDKKQAQAAKENNDNLYYEISSKMRDIQDKMSELAAKMENNN